MSCSTAGRHQTGFLLIILGNLVQECAEDWGLERHHYIPNNIQYYDTDWTQPWASCSYLFGCVNPSYLSKVWELIQGIVILKAVTHFRWQWNNTRYLHFVDRMHIFNHFSTWEREEKHFFSHWRKLRCFENIPRSLARPPTGSALKNWVSLNLNFHIQTRQRRALSGNEIIPLLYVHCF